MLAQQHRAIVAEHRLGTPVTGNIHDNNFVSIKRVPDAVVGVNCPVCAPFKITPRGTDQGLLVF